MAGTKWMIGLAGAAALFFSGCGGYGKVEQGRVVSFDRQSGQVILIRDSLSGRTDKPQYDALPPLVVKAPADPAEMGPEPAAGKLMRVDAKQREILVFDAAAGGFSRLSYQLVDSRPAAKGEGLPAIDRERKTITIYCAAEKMAITFAASDDLLAMPADTWRSGDEVRYYYKEPGIALRMMNVSKTDLNAGG
jgi:hypothetical protein